MRVRVRGKYWDLQYVPNLGDNLGIVDHEKQTIRIQQGQSEYEEFDTVLHELLHAYFEYYKETPIAEASSDISKILWKMGWGRKVKPGGT